MESDSAEASRDGHRGQRRRNDCHGGGSAPRLNSPRRSCRGRWRATRAARGHLHRPRPPHEHLGGLTPEAQSALAPRAFGGGRMGTSIMQLYGNLPALAQKSGQIGAGSTNQRFMSDWADDRDAELPAASPGRRTRDHRYGVRQVCAAHGDRGRQALHRLPQRDREEQGAGDRPGTAITAILVPAIGLYLYRALLSSWGAIRSALSAYARLITGQSGKTRPSAAWTPPTRCP